MTSLHYNTDKESFRSLWRRNLIPGQLDDSSQDLHQRLIAAYRQPHRVYHTLSHIESCLNIFCEVQDLVENPDAIALAIWFHDAIYEIDAKDNEKRSADWFMQESENRLLNELRDRVYSHIMATEHCGDNLHDQDSSIMVDIDLFSFGKPWQAFLVDSENVRAEKADISDQDFYPRQCGFQKNLMTRPRFFQSEYFYQHYEHQARNNIADFIAIIDKKLEAVAIDPNRPE